MRAAVAVVQQEVRFDSWFDGRACAAVCAEDEWHVRGRGKAGLL